MSCRFGRDPSDSDNATSEARRDMVVSEDRAYLSAVVSGALDGIIAIDQTGIIQSFNRAAAELFGYTPDEVIGRNVSLLMPEPYRGGHDTFIKKYLETGIAKIIGIGRVVEGQRKDGSVFPMELGVTAVNTGDRRFFVGFIHDLSERRRFEARMEELHAGRLDLIENMTIGLTHELKQPLAATNFYLNIARKMLNDKSFSKDAIEQSLDNAIKQVFRVSEIMDNLRQFIARGETVKTVQSLNEVIRTACVFTETISKEQNVETMVHLEAANDRVLINRVQIQQVVINLKRNAVEAMQHSEKRELTVSTRLVGGNMIRTDIADTGPGLSESVKNRLFEPFTTTKPQGLGVGLSISRSIIEAHQGKILVEPNPGGGAVFGFILPLAEG